MNKRILAILLAVLMCVALFAGCTGNTPAASSAAAESKADAESKAESKAESQAEPDPLGADFAGYPVKSDETLDFYVIDTGSCYKAPEGVARNDNEFEKQLAAATGINVNWIDVPAGGDVDQAYNLMLSSNDMPDMFYKWGVTEVATQLIDDGKIVDLTEYLPKYATAYYGFVTADENVDKSVKNDEGKYYGFAFLREDLFLGTYAGPAIRKDLLDKAGLEVPTTMDEWTAAMAAFKDQNLVKYPYSCRSKLSDLYTPFLGAWGLRAGFYVGDDQKIHYSYAEPAMKEFLGLMADWNAKGYFDPDFLTNDSAALETKVLNDEIGATETTGGTFAGYEPKLKAQNCVAEWVAAPYPSLVKGEKSKAIQGETNNIGIVGCVTTSCENIPLACRFLDYGYTKDGMLLFNMGELGKWCEMKDNGHYGFTDAFNDDPRGQNVMMATYNAMSGNSATLNMLDQFYSKPQIQQDFVNVWYDASALGSLLPGSLTMTTDESTSIAGELTAINTLVDETISKYVLGQESLDNYDAFVATINGMGLDHVLSVYNDAYARYLAR